MTDYLEPYRKLARAIRFAPQLGHHERFNRLVHQPLPIPSVLHTNTVEVGQRTLAATKSEPDPDPSQHTAALVSAAVSKHTVLPTVYSIVENVGDRISRLGNPKQTRLPIVLPKIPEPDPNWIPSTPPVIEHLVTTPQAPVVAKAITPNVDEQSAVIATQTQPVEIKTDTTNFEANTTNVEETAEITTPETEPVSQTESTTATEEYQTIEETESVNQTESTTTIEETQTVDTIEPTTTIEETESVNQTESTTTIEEPQTVDTIEPTTTIEETESVNQTQIDNLTETTEIVESELATVTEPEILGDLNQVTTNAEKEELIAEDDAPEDLNQSPAIVEPESPINQTATQPKVSETTPTDQQKTHPPDEPLPTEQTKLPEPEKTQITCPQCKSNDVRKNGKQKDKQKYLCKDCGRQFVWSESVEEKVKQHSEVKEGSKSNNQSLAKKQKLAKDKLKNQAKGFGRNKKK